MNCGRSAHKELQTTMGQPQIETELPDSQPVSQSSTQRRHDQGRMAELNAQLVVIKVNLLLCSFAVAPDVVVLN